MLLVSNNKSLWVSFWFILCKIGKKISDVFQIEELNFSVLGMSANDIIVECSSYWGHLRDPQNYLGPVKETR